MFHRSTSRTSLLALALAGSAALVAADRCALAQATQPDTAPAEARPAADLPKAEKILEQAFEAMGGKKALENITSLQTTFEAQQMGQTTTINTYWHKENKARLEQEGPQGTATIVMNGDVAYMHHPMMGYQLMTPQQAEGIRQQAGMHLFLFNETRNDEGEFREGMETVALEDFDGTKSYKIKLPREEEQSPNEEGFLYIAEENHLPVGMSMKSNNPMGGSMSARIFFRDWETVGDLKLFKKLVAKQGQQESVMNYKDFKINETDPSVFELPDEVKEMAGINEGDEESGKDSEHPNNGQDK